MKLLLIELDYHPEVVEGIGNHLDPSDTAFSIVTRSHIYDQIKFNNQPENVYLVEKKEPVSRVFERENILKKEWDLVLFTTVHSNFKELPKLNFNAPTAVIVHNVHAFFDLNKIKPKWTPFFLWKDFSFFIRKIVLRNEFHFRKKFLTHVDYFLFPDEFMYAYAAAHYPKYASKFISTPIRWASSKQLKSTQPKDTVGITTIGTIDQRRRDYSQLINLIPYLEAHSSKNITVTLAGKPFGSYGRGIIKKLKSLASKKIRIQTFDGFVPEHKIHQIVAETDVFFAPIIHETRHHIWTEYYGKTKISGNINNAIEYGKTTLIPDFYPTSEMFDGLFLKYATQEELRTHIMTIVRNAPIKNVHKTYSQSAIKEQLSALFASLQG